VAELKVSISYDAIISESGSAEVTRRWDLANSGDRNLDFRRFFLSCECSSRDVAIRRAVDSQGRTLRCEPIPTSAGDLRIEVDFETSIPPNGSYWVELVYSDPNYCFQFDGLNLWILHKWFRETPFKLMDLNFGEEGLRNFTYTVHFPDFRPKVLGIKNWLYRTQIDTISPASGSPTHKNAKGISEIGWQFNMVPDEPRRYFYMAYQLTHRDIAGPLFSIARTASKIFGI
jgi:hypothetical protein